MLRTTIFAALAAAAIIGAPIAAADELTNAEVMQTDTQDNSGQPGQGGIIEYATGNNAPSQQPWIYSGPDCQPIMGTWDDDGFHPNPNGTEIAFGSDPHNLRSAPYKTGVNNGY